jgi:hypothetical protein
LSMNFFCASVRFYPNRFCRCNPAGIRTPQLLSVDKSASFQA